MQTFFRFMRRHCLIERLRVRMVGLLILLLVSEAIFALPGNPQSARIPPSPMPGLQGEAATQYLKQNGLYNSFRETALTAINSQSFSEIKKLTTVDGAEGDQFSFSVAIYGDTAIVGTPGDEIMGGGGQGSVYIFQRNQDGTEQWGQVKNLTASDGEPGDNFGASVAIYEDTVIVGANLDGIGFNAFQGSAMSSSVTRAAQITGARSRN